MSNTELNLLLEEQIKMLQSENRRLNRENTRLKHAALYEKTAYTSILNQEKARTYKQREMERYLMLLLANSPNIIIFLGKTDRIEFCTNYFIKKTGSKSMEDVMGSTVASVLMPFMGKEAHEELLQLIEKVAQSNESLSFEASFSFEDEVSDYAGLIVPMTGESGNAGIGGSMLLFHEITELKRKREEALAANLAKSYFLSSISHEIRTPLNAITGMTYVGKKDGSLAGKDEAFGRIESASNFLLGVINDVLDISKIESGKMELTPIDFCFSSLIDRVASVVSVNVEKKSQDLILDIDPDIPNNLVGDDHCLAQVIINILSNAVKFSSDNSKIKMTVGLLGKNNERCALEFRIADTGIGMTKEEQSKIFTAFQQAETGISRKYGGSGLGLSITKRILELMDSEITVESEKGKGTVFTFSVSFLISKKATQHLQDQAESHHHDFAGKTVLIVDDIDINIEIAASMLESTNINIVKANSGKSAIDLFAKSQGGFDLILMDMQMPGIDGLQATTFIRGLNAGNAKTVPIIAMTANAFKEDINKCIAAGMNNHIGKPINADELMDTIAGYL